MIINDKQMPSMDDIFVNNIMYLQLRQKEQNVYILDKYIHLSKVLRVSVLALIFERGLNVFLRYNAF